MHYGNAILDSISQQVQTQGPPSRPDMAKAQRKSTSVGGSNSPALGMWSPEGRVQTRAHGKRVLGVDNVSPPSFDNYCVQSRGNFDVFSLISMRYSVWLGSVGVRASVVSLARWRGDPLLGKLGHKRVIVVWQPSITLKCSRGGGTSAGKPGPRAGSLKGEGWWDPGQVAGVETRVLWKHLNLIL